MSDTEIEEGKKVIRLAGEPICLELSGGRSTNLAGAQRANLSWDPPFFHPGSPSKNKDAGLAYVPQRNPDPFKVVLLPRPTFPVLSKNTLCIDRTETYRQRLC